MTDIPDIEKALDRLHETAEQLAEIEHFEGRVPGCDYEPIFKGSVDLLDARSLIAALRDERDEALADRAAQAERMARLEEALRPFAKCADQLDGDDDIPRAPDGEWAKFRLLTDDYRRARRAISQEGSEPS